MQTVSRHGAYVVVQPPHGGIACRGFVTKAEAWQPGGSPVCMSAKPLNLSSNFLPREVANAPPSKHVVVSQYRLAGFSKQVFGQVL